VSHRPAESPVLGVRKVALSNFGEKSDQIDAEKRRTRRRTALRETVCGKKRRILLYTGCGDTARILGHVGDTKFCGSDRESGRNGRGFGRTTVYGAARRGRCLAVIVGRYATARTRLGIAGYIDRAGNRAVTQDGDERRPLKRQQRHQKTQKERKKSVLHGSPLGVLNTPTIIS